MTNPPKSQTPDLSKSSAANGTPTKPKAVPPPSVLSSSLSAASNGSLTTETAKSTISTATSYSENRSESYTSFEQTVELSQPEVLYKDLKYDGKCRLTAKCWDIVSQSWRTSTLDLNQYLGCVDHKLALGSGFCDHFHVTEFDGTHIVAHHEKSKEVSKFCLDGHLNVINGKLHFTKFKFEDLSAMMSGIPWMKFRIVAEPNIDVFRTHGAVDQTIEHISLMAVKHVSESLRIEINKRIEEAIHEVTKSTVAYIKATMTQSASYAAHVVGSHTDHVHLHHHQEYPHHHHYDLPKRAPSVKY